MWVGCKTVPSLADDAGGRVPVVGARDLRLALPDRATLSACLPFHGNRRRSSRTALGGKAHIPSRAQKDVALAVRLCVPGLCRRGRQWLVGGAARGRQFAPCPGI